MERDIKNKNSNYHRIDNMILTAFLNISSQKPYNQITVTELCNEANVNRTTFYKHYRGTWEIKDRIAGELVEVAMRIINEFKGKDFLNNSIEVFREVNKELESRLDYYMSIFKMKNSNIFSEVIVESIKDSLVNGFVKFQGETSIETIQVAFTYFAGGIISTYRGWFAGRISGTLDDMALILSQYIRSSFIKK